MGPDEQALDSRALDVLRARAGEQDPALIEDVVGEFLVRAPSRLASLREAVARDERPTVEAGAHALAGACAELGAVELQRRCKDLERVANTATTDELHHQVDQVEAAFVRIRSALQAVAARG